MKLKIKKEKISALSSIKLVLEYAETKYLMHQEEGNYLVIDKDLNIVMSNSLGFGGIVPTGIKSIPELFSFL